MTRPAGSRDLRHSLGWSISTDAAAKGSVLFLSILAARALDPERFAQFVGLMAVALLAAAVWDLGVSQLVAREVASGRVTSSSAVRCAVRLRALALPLWAVAFAIGSAVVAALGPIESGTLVLFALGSLVAGARMVLAAVLQGVLAFGAAGLALASGRLVSALVAVAVLAVDGGSRLLALASAVLVGELVACLLTLGWFVRLPVAGRPPDRLADRSRLTLRASAPFAANSLMSTVYNRLDIVLVAALTPAFQAGLYAPASRIQDALLLLPASLGVVALPIVARNWGESPSTVRRQIRQLMVVGCLITVPVALVVAVFAPTILRVVLGEDYVGAAGLVRILVWSVVLTALAAPLLAGLAGIGHAPDTTKVFAAAFATAVIAHLSLDWWWGATGAAVATLSRDPVALVVALYLSWRAGLLSDDDAVAEAQQPVAAPVTQGHLL